MSDTRVHLQKAALELETADLKTRLNRLEQDRGESELKRKTEVCWCVSFDVVGTCIVL